MIALTNQDWKKTINKWKKNKDHTGRCPLCQKAGPRCQGCPLLINAKCCGGLWIQWRDNQTEDNAALVKAFIEDKYDLWKHAPKNKEKPKPVKSEPPPSPKDIKI